MDLVCPGCGLSRSFSPRAGERKKLTTRCSRCEIRFSIDSSNGNFLGIECPKCQKTQPVQDFCSFCGVIYRKYSVQKVEMPEVAVLSVSTPQPPRRRWGWALGSCLVLILLLGGLWQMKTGNGSVASFVFSDSPPVIEMMATGTYHTVVCRADGTVWAWGRNTSGQLGIGMPGGQEGVMEPVPVTGLDDVVAVDAGLSFSIALKSDGTVWTWGDNDCGQLGLGTSVRIKPAPTEVPGLSGVVAIAAGREHAMALTADGEVWAWGENSMGQLGITDIPLRINSPKRIRQISDIVAIDAGELQSLALNSQGEVYAWGGNFYGEIGNGGFEDQHRPLEILELPWITSISAGNGVSVALDTEGNLWHWGRVHTPPSRDMGSTATDVWREHGCETRPIQVAGIDHVERVSAGGGRVLALKNGGELWTWKTYKSNDDLRDVNPFIPTLVKAGTNNENWGPIGSIERFVAGSRHCLALHTDGTLWAWGKNYYGQLGVGITKRGYTPTPVSEETGVLVLGNVVVPEETEVAVIDTSGMDIACGQEAGFLLRGGRLWSWGNNDSGQLGRGSKRDRNPEDRYPAEIEFDVPGGLLDVAAGHKDGFALSRFGEVWSWGKKEVLEKKDNSSSKATRVTKMLFRPESFAGLKNIRSIAPGIHHALALDSDGRVFSWGNNEFGELGIGTMGLGEVSVDVQAVEGLEGITAISAGNHHSLALDENGRVSAWGENKHDQLGGSHNDNYPYPMLVPGLDDVIAIEACNRFSLALTKDGNVMFWGEGIYGDYSTGRSAHVSATPVKVNGLQGITAIACGGKLYTNVGFALALSEDGKVWAWGNNSRGQLGTGSEGGENLTPTEVPGLSNVVKIAAGKDFSLALRSDGTVWGWGRSMGGQLGGQIATASPVPVFDPAVED